MKLRLFSALLLAGLLTAAAAFARQPVDELYDKAEYRIAMRDSVKLYTAVYTPKTDAKASILIFRTPYGCAPYGPGEFPRSFGSGYMRSYIDRGYIVVMQDVRGRFMRANSSMSALRDTAKRTRRRTATIRSSGS